MLFLYNNDRFNNEIEIYKVRYGLFKDFLIALIRFLKKIIFFLILIY